MIRIALFFFAILYVLLGIQSKVTEINVEFVVEIDSNPIDIASQKCRGMLSSCENWAIPLIQLHQSRVFGVLLHDWTYNPICRSDLPKQKKRSHLQYLHIPKSSSSINFLLHDYFQCRINSTSPCPNALDTEELQMKGLCNGQLFSCMGHHVKPNLPNIVLSEDTNILTFLRHPWNRIQSDFHYTHSHMQSRHHGDDFNVTDLISRSNKNILLYATYPGISNCMTKMLNGLQCADSSVILDWHHVNVAKSVLDRLLFFGLTEYFHTSVCLFSWLYGGQPNESHVVKTRVGQYKYLKMEQALTKEEQQIFLDSEKYDIALYAYAEFQFLEKVYMTNLPIIN